MKIIDVRWFCGQSNVGIVKMKDEYDTIFKYYIGSPPGLEWGLNEEEDKQWLADWGSYFPTEVGDVLFGDDELRNGNAVQIPQNKEQAILMYQIAKNYLGLGDVV